MAGAMGWDDRRFYSSTMRYFFNAYKGWAEARQVEHRRSWEQARIIAYITARGSGMDVKPSDIVPLHWIDELQKADDFPEITKEQYDKFGQEADEIFLKMQSEWQQ